VITRFPYPPLIIFLLLVAENIIEAKPYDLIKASTTIPTPIATAILIKVPIRMYSVRLRWPAPVRSPKRKTDLAAIRKPMAVD